MTRKPGRTSGTARRFAVGATPLLLLIVYLACLLIDPGDVGFDTTRRLQSAHALWTGAAELLDEDRDAGRNYDKNIAVGPNGEPHYGYGLAQPLLMLPGDMLGTALATILPPSDNHANADLQLRKTVVALTVFPLLAVLTACVLQTMFVATGLSYWAANWAVLLGFVATRWLNVAQVYQETGLHLLCLLGAVTCLVAWRDRTDRKYLLGAGALFGVLVLIRVVTLLDVFVVGCAGLALAWDRSRPARDLAVAGATLAGCVAVALIVDRLYHHHRFGSWGGTYAGLYFRRVAALRAASPVPLAAPFGDPAFPWTTPLGDGVAQALVSPEWGLVWFDGMAVLAVYLYLRFARTVGRTATILLLAALALLAGYLLFYARYYEPAGWGAWGNRYLEVPAVVLSLLGVAMLVRTWPLHRPADRAISLLLCGGAIVVQLASAVFSHSLEITQLLAGCGSRWIVAQRLRNVASLLAGHPPAAGCGAAVPDWQRDPSVFAAAVIRHSAENPARQHLAAAAWGVGFCLLVGAVWRFVALWRRSRGIAVA
jgi:hypothetical protein